MQATHTTSLTLPMLPAPATDAHVFPQMTRGLVSVGQLCDADCTALFTKNDVTITHNNKTIITGERETASGLWTLPQLLSNNNNTTATNNMHVTNNVYELTTKTAFVQYLHQCCFSPSTPTWLSAIKAGYFGSWPALNADLVTKHLPKSDATVKGHQRQQYQGTRSTKQTATIHHDDVPPLATSAAPTHEVYTTVHEATGQIYTDQTGRFPAISSRGYKYIMILYHYDTNAILTHPLKSRHGDELTQAYKNLFMYLTERGFKPVLQKLDNEAPATLKKFMRDNGVDYQLVPPHVHRRNAAERAISTFKDHFIAGLCSTDKSFPLHLWDRLLPQCTLTLNLLRPSRLNPAISAQEQLNGRFDFNRTPLAPPGHRVLVHVKPNMRETFAAHSVDGWYVGPAMEHYRCYRTYISKTGHERVSDTVEFMPEKRTVPSSEKQQHNIIQAILLADTVTAAATENSNNSKN